MPSPENIKADLHDARIASLTLSVGGDLEITFRHVDVFIHSHGPKYETWAFSAVLVVRGVSSLRLNGPMHEDGWVSDWAVPGEAGRLGLIELLRATSEVELGEGEVSLTFVNGSRLEVEGNQSSFRLTNAGRYYQDFIEE